MGTPRVMEKGEVMLWRRSHLGSARDQGLIAWDYDADLAVVHVPGCDAVQELHSAKKIEMLGYHCTPRSMATKRPPQEGKTATSPHGSTCVDIEMYEVSPNNAVKVRGTTTFSLALKHLFPTASGVFGPLRCRAPSTVRVFDASIRP